MCSPFFLCSLFQCSVPNPPDRHLDNLLLCPDGRLFHVDFGFIFGRDPKLFPPPMKLCREMVEAMGGPDSAGHARFATLSCEAFLQLRRAAPALLAATAPWCGSAPGGGSAAAGGGGGGLPDLAGGPDAVLATLEQKLVLALDEEAAVAHYARLLAESASALFEGLKENAHRIAQYWR